MIGMTDAPPMIPVIGGWRYRPQCRHVLIPVIDQLGMHAEQIIDTGNHAIPITHINAMTLRALRMTDGTRPHLIRPLMTIRAHPPHPLMRVIHHPVGGGSIPVRIEFSGHLGTLGFQIVETRPRVPVRAITATRVLERTGSRGCQLCVTIRASPPAIPRVRWRYRDGIVIIDIIRVLHGDIGIQGGKIGLTWYGSTAITIGTTILPVMRPV